MGGRRLSFWLAVAGVSILSQFALELVNEKFPQLGLAKLTDFAHGNKAA